MTQSDDDIELIAVKPVAASAAELERFEELVVEAGEVIGAALTTNIANARILVMLKHEGVLCGVAALKRPQDSYRKRVASQAEIALPKPEYPYELGYIYVQPKLQGRHLSHRLVAEALEHRDGAHVFATARIDNDRVRSTLAKARFAVAGKPYDGLQGKPIGLLVRLDSSAAD